MAQNQTEASLDLLKGMRRRKLMQRAGLGVAGAAVMAAGGVSLGGSRALASEPNPITDADILNFALNLEYLEAEFYLRAAYGHGLPDADVGGTVGTLGGVTGGTAVPFTTPAFSQYAKEIAREEANHVKFLRTALWGNHVARPTIDLEASFTTAARAAGIVGPTGTFNPFADENSFLLGSFIFEDVGVSAYHGAAPLIQDKGILAAAAGILAVEAYHAGIIRTLLYQLGLSGPVQKIVILRKTASGAVNPPDDYGIIVDGQSMLVDADLTNSLAFSRTFSQVVNVVTLGNGNTGMGGFFPKGLNGAITT